MQTITPNKTFFNGDYTNMYGRVYPKAPSGPTKKIQTPKTLATKTSEEKMKAVPPSSRFRQGGRGETTKGQEGRAGTTKGQKGAMTNMGTSSLGAIAKQPEPEGVSSAR